MQEVLFQDSDVEVQILTHFYQHSILVGGRGEMNSVNNVMSKISYDTLTMLRYLLMAELPHMLDCCVLRYPKVVTTKQSESFLSGIIGAYKRSVHGRWHSVAEGSFPIASGSRAIIFWFFC